MSLDFHVFGLQQRGPIWTFPVVGFVTWLIPQYKVTYTLRLVFTELHQMTSSVEPLLKHVQEIKILAEI